MHALNMAWLMLGYDKEKQWHKYSYPYVQLFFNEKTRVGLSGTQFAKQLIEPYFSHYSWRVGDSMPWDVLNTDYTERVTIVLTQTNTSWFGILHYIVVVAESDDGHSFIVTDTTQKLYKITDTQLSSLMRIYTPSVPDYNAYRIG